MSTTPGDSTWTDAGLLPVDDTDPTDLTGDPEPADDEQAPEEPVAPLTADDPVPDANEADVLEQSLAVPDDGTDDHRG